MGRGPELPSAISAAEEALPQRADLAALRVSSGRAGFGAANAGLPVKNCFSIDPTGGWRPGCSGRSFSVETLKERADESDVLPENLLQCVKNAAQAAPRLYQQSSGFILPVVELEERGCTLQARSPRRYPRTDRPADRVPDGNGALIAGQKLDGYRGASLCCWKPGRSACAGPSAAWSGKGRASFSG